jgi:alpha-glucosidase (family GH31 glycosyl hydrolase)
MRPMFVEFPEEEALFGTATQFMFGDNILISPKLDQPHRQDQPWQSGDLTAKWLVRTQLPQSANWYNLAEEGHLES